MKMQSTPQQSRKSSGDWYEAASAQPFESLKHVYSFGPGAAEGDADGNDLLGVKGARLVGLCDLALATPPGFAITARAGADFIASDGRVSPGLGDEVRWHLSRLEKQTGKSFGCAEHPLLIAVRSGAEKLVPSAPAAILNVGLNDRVVEGLGRCTGDRFGSDCYRRLISAFGMAAKGIAAAEFDQALLTMKRTRGIVNDIEMTDDDWEECVRRYKAVYERHAGEGFPEDPFVQLEMAIKAAIRAPSSDERRPDRPAECSGAAVIVQAMVFGNLDDQSATGTAFTRDPLTGDDIVFGGFRVMTQGDIINGVGKPLDCASRMENWSPGSWRQLLDARAILEGHYGDMQEFDFTIESGRLFVLQSKSGWRTPEAAEVISRQMATLRTAAR